MKSQRRGAKIAMDVEERDAFLAAERTCRVATVGGDGAPHVTPLWFVWDGSALWLTSVVRSQRWTDLQRDPRVSVVVDAGTEFTELRGVELCGVAEAVGEVPRTGEPAPGLDTPRAALRRQVRRWHRLPRRPSCVAADRARQDRQLGLPQDGDRRLTRAPSHGSHRKNRRASPTPATVHAASTTRFATGTPWDAGS